MVSLWKSLESKVTIKALLVGMKAGDLANVVTAKSKVLLAKRKRKKTKNCQRRKERSELRLKEIA